MSETLISAQSADQLPSLPETHPIDPIIQCGVLYLGTAPTSPGLCGLDSIQQPFSHRYPVDGTNTVRGIDAVLSVYDNGVQLAFTRQPHTVIFFPINSLIYCANLRFSIIENGQTKPSSAVDWRFMPLDAITSYENKHPPLFAAVVQRTQILPGEECHCFITKSTDSAITLVRAILEVYANVQPRTKCLKSPIFYQLDRFGRRLSEITGVVYISPANDDDSQLTQANGNRFTDAIMLRHYLFDPSYEGFFYRTDMSIIEQWQLWDDDDVNQFRPRPPASPFGLHEGLYHDDTTNEVQQYLRHMDDEDPSCSCTSSTSTQTSTSTVSSISVKYSRKHNRYSSNKPKSIEDTDEFNLSLSNLHKSSFEPVKPEKKSKTKKRPIIIEKVVPNPILTIPILNPKLPSTLTEPIQESQVNHTQSEDSYEINEYGEKITKEGNRIVFMDVVQMKPKQPSNDIPTHKSSSTRVRSYQHRTSNRIPMIDMGSIERLFNEENTKNLRRLSLNVDIQSQIKTSDPIESNDKKQRKSGVVSSTYGSKNESHRHHSTTIAGTRIPMMDMRSIERLFNEENTKNLRRLSVNADIQSQIKTQDPIESNDKKQRKSSVVSSTYSSKNESHRHYSTTITGTPIPMIDMRNIERLFNEESPKNLRRLSLNADIQSPIKTLDPIESNDKKQRKSSVVSSTHSSKNESHRHHSTIITGAPTINYVERSFTPSLPPSQIISPTLPILTDAKLNEYISNIYGTTRSVKSTSSSITTNQGSKPNSVVVNPTYVSPFRYMQSTLNRNLIEEYRNAY